MTANPFGASGSAQTKSGGSGSSGPTRSSRVQNPDESVVRFILAAVEANDGLVEYPLHNDDAAEVSELLEADIPDNVRELLEALPEEVEFLSIQDFFGVDFRSDGFEYIGTEPKLNETDKGEWSDLSEEVKDRYNDDEIYAHGDEENGVKAYPTHPDWLEVLREGQVDGDSVYDITRLVNGNHYPVIWENLSDEQKGKMAKLGAGVGKSYNNSDEFEKRQNVHFSIMDGASAKGQVLNALVNEGAIDQETADAAESGEMTNAEVVDEIGN